MSEINKIYFQSGKWIYFFWPTENIYESMIRTSVFIKSATPKGRGVVQRGMGGSNPLWDTATSQKLTWKTRRLVNPEPCTLCGALCHPLWGMVGSMTGMLPHRGVYLFSTRRKHLRNHDFVHGFRRSKINKIYFQSGNQTFRHFFGMSKINKIYFQLGFWPHMSPYEAAYLSYSRPFLWVDGRVPPSTSRSVSD